MGAEMPIYEFGIRACQGFQYLAC